MRVDEAISFAYSPQYRSSDMVSPHQPARSNSTDHACRQALAGMIYRAVERQPEHQAALVRLCYTEEGGVVDQLVVVRYVMEQLQQTHRSSKLPGWLSAVAGLAVANFPGVEVGRDIYSRADFARAAGLTIERYTKAALPIQRRIEDILVTVLAEALEPVRRIIKQQEE